MSSRANSSNAAFGLKKTYPFTECITDEAFTEYCTKVPAQAPVKTFTDDKGWVPGHRGPRRIGCFWRYAEGSVVVPSVDGAPYSTRVVNPDGSPATDVLRRGPRLRPLGTGNPADAGVGYGTKVDVKASLFDKVAFLRITAPRAG